MGQDGCRVVQRRLQRQGSGQFPASQAVLRDRSETGRLGRTVTLDLPAKAPCIREPNQSDVLVANDGCEIAAPVRG